MGMSRAEGIAPQKANEPIGGEVERGRPALGTGRQLPVRVGVGITDPGAESDQRGAVGAVEVEGRAAGCDQRDKEGSNEESAF